MKPAPRCVLVILLAVGLAGCASAATSASALPELASTAIGSASPSEAPSPSGGSSSAPTTAGLGVAVNLTFTGTTPFTAIGSAGRCTPITYGSNQAGLVFDASGVDYPGLGAAFGVEVSDLPNIKWQVQGDTYYIGTSGLSLSADHHTITLDVPLKGAVPAGAIPPGPEHVQGTIVCP